MEGFDFLIVINQQRLAIQSLNIFASLIEIHIDFIV